MPRIAFQQSVVLVGQCADILWQLGAGLPKTTGSQNVSQSSSAARPKIRECLFGEPLKLPRFRIPLNGPIEVRGLELLEPGAKPLQLVEWQVGDGSFDIFKLRHGELHPVRCVIEYGAPG
jgi:hypothetical protein